MVKVAFTWGVRSGGEAIREEKNDGGRSAAAPCEDASDHAPISALHALGTAWRKRQPYRARRDTNRWFGGSKTPGIISGPLTQLGKACGHLSLLADASNWRGTLHAKRAAE